MKRILFLFLFAYSLLQAKGSYDSNVIGVHPILYMPYSYLYSSGCSNANPVLSYPWYKQQGACLTNISLEGRYGINVHLDSAQDALTKKGSLLKPPPGCPANPPVLYPWDANCFTNITNPEEYAEWVLTDTLVNAVKRITQGDTINGTANYIPKFNASGHSIGNSSIITNGIFNGVGRAATNRFNVESTTNQGVFVYDSTFNRLIGRIVNSGSSGQLDLYNATVANDETFYVSTSGAVSTAASINVGTNTITDGSGGSLFVYGSGGSNQYIELNEAGDIETHAGIGVGTLVAGSGNVSLTNGSMRLLTAGDCVNIKTGNNASRGEGQLVLGVDTVFTAAITDTTGKTAILLTDYDTLSGSILPNPLAVTKIGGGGVSNNRYFIFKSASVTDITKFWWFIMNEP